MPGKRAGRARDSGNAVLATTDGQNREMCPPGAERTKQTEAKRQPRSASRRTHLPVLSGCRSEHAFQNPLPVPPASPASLAARWRPQPSAVFWWMNAVDEGDGVLSFAFVYEGWTVLTGSLGVFCSFSVFLCYFTFVLFYLRLFCF